MQYSLVFFLSVSLAFAGDFMTQMEYAKMLYENPRGIGCVHCHGPKGEGKVLARFKEKGKEKEIVAPSLHGLSKERFAKGILASKSVMPTYFLTNDEIESLYYFVTNIQNNDKGK
ncbi:c-type cytochrome [Sulfurospirillum sp. T05]|uniref:C-type cytochrome n=1 Tax=Sulfurospirillum tamanense TaxID=2813362 RepID=A0ABS2WT54_9BACT|nr:c-type cytochrome [Sulfurospirillum tamanensis]MBN2964775.1 c-type cytochrome [Sulfurospirillum tamanensis]